MVGETEKKTGNKPEKATEKHARRPGPTYDGFITKLNERIPDGLLVDQLERELHLGGDEPDQRQMAIRQRARQDIEAHKGYRRSEKDSKQDANRKGAAMIVRIIKFSEEVNGGK
ncbi:MAG: hypothetical protein ABSC19_04955 [Syntrophorhabdales bacterium]|jgi:hypothetical protein